MPEWTVIGQSHRTELDPDRDGEVRTGWRVKWKDALTSVVGDTFVPDAVYPAGAETLIRADVEAVRQVHATGQ